jgi:hypothetical protein
MQMATDRKLMQLMASALGVKITDGDNVDYFAILEVALTQLGIKCILPHNAQHVGIAELSDELSRGDHIIVRSAGSNAVFHHGIYIGPYAPQGEPEPANPKSKKKYVVDMFGETYEGKEGARIRIRTMDDFMRTKGFPELAVIRYSNDTQAAKDISADLALFMQSMLHDCTGLYDLLGRNCSHFATWCRTMRWVSADVSSAATQAHDALRRLPRLKAPLSKSLHIFMRQSHTHAHAAPSQMGVQ